MITNTSSSFSLFFWLRLAVTVLLSISNLFMLVAISTDFWIYGYDSKIGPLYAGLWKVCTLDGCFGLNDIIYSKILLVLSLVFGILYNIVSVLALVYGTTIMKKRRLTFGMIAEGIVALVGMGSATGYFVLQTVFIKVGYSLILGWISTVLLLVAGIVNCVLYAKEPDTEMNDETRQIAPRATQVPSYT